VSSDGQAEDSQSYTYLRFSFISSCAVGRNIIEGEGGPESTTLNTNFVGKAIAKRKYHKGVVGSMNFT
jgi:hypothetical protein